MWQTSLILLLLAFSGCSSIKQEPVNPVEVVTIQKSAPVYHPPLPGAVTFRKIVWRVWTPALMKEYIEELEREEAPVVVQYGLTPQSYENLTNSIADLKRYIIQIKSIVKYYRETAPSEGEELNIPE